MNAEGRSSARWSRGPRPRRNGRCAPGAPAVSACGRRTRGGERRGMGRLGRGARAASPPRRWAVRPRRPGACPPSVVGRDHPCSDHPCSGSHPSRARRGLAPMLAAPGPPVSWRDTVQRGPVVALVSPCAVARCRPRRRRTASPTRSSSMSVPPRPVGAAGDTAAAERPFGPDGLGRRRGDRVPCPAPDREPARPGSPPTGSQERSRPGPPPPAVPRPGRPGSAASDPRRCDPFRCNLC